MALHYVNLVKLRKPLTCSFHATSIVTAKPGKAFAKVLGLSKKRKPLYEERPTLPSPYSLSKGSNEGHYSGNSRRASTLNKLFMRYITDLMVTGESASEFQGHGIQINRVQISPDYNGLNIFWVAKGSKDNENVEKMLKKNAGYLRHELSQLRLIGVVPMIYFVKDKQFAKIAEVDERLARADYGEDYQPVHLETLIKTQLEIHTPLPQNIKEKLKELDEQVGEESQYEEPLPPMVHDVLGLNHGEIMHRIQKSMRKAEAAHRCSSAYDQLETTVNENPVEYSREAFRDFLEKRQLMKSKLKQNKNKNYTPDMHHIRQELEERQAEYFQNMDIFDYKEDEQDYIDDEPECK